MRQQRKQTPYPAPWTARQALDAIENWADGCLLLRETGMFGNGRLDGLLVRSHFHSVLKLNGFYGVEVKLSRSDFLGGLSSGQYDRYAASLNGLYIATGYDVCKTREIPDDYGHLVVACRDHKPVCVCRRHAEHNDGPKIDDDRLWRWVIDIGDQFVRREQRIRKDVEGVIQRIKSQGATQITNYLARLR